MIFDDQLTGILKPTVCHGKVVVVLDRLPVDDEGEVIAAVFEVIADVYKRQALLRALSVMDWPRT